MKKRDIRKPGKVTGFQSDPEPDEVSFWLVKIAPRLMEQVDARRKHLGHNKKVTVTCMALAYLQATDSDHPPLLRALSERADAVNLSLKSLPKVGR